MDGSRTYQIWQYKIGKYPEFLGAGRNTALNMTIFKEVIEMQPIWCLGT